MTLAAVGLLSAALSLPLLADIASKSGAGTAGDAWDHLLFGVVSTLIYGVIGIFLALLGMKVFEWSTPYSVRKELEEDHNSAVAIVMGSMTLGICIIIAATILS